MSPPSDAARHVDLHLHTTRSDGRWEPRRVLAEAAARGFAAVSITDHDVLGAIDEAAAAHEHGVQLLPGIELTADWNGRTVHILGHGIDPAEPRLRAALERAERAMGAHVDRVLAALDAAGTPIAREQLEKYRVKYAGGASLVLAMVEHGVLRRAANGGGLLRLASREPRGYTAAEAIDLIHGAGGLASLAHPVKIRKDRPLLDADDLRPLAAAGLDGIEVWQIVHGPRERAHYAGLADELGLLPIGGSDCHGPRRTGGPRLGSQRVPYLVYEAMLERLAARRGSPELPASKPAARGTATVGDGSPS
ncbi:MAG: PHP domain-containing protein [Chloroflexota bacterium]|nr:PHP domain-containing protein [Chloroflexota bacterium]